MAAPAPVPSIPQKLFICVDCQYGECRALSRYDPLMCLLADPDDYQRPEDMPRGKWVRWSNGQ